MGRQWYYFFFLLWFSYLVISSVLLFSRGFLLTKNTFKENSTCISFANIPCLLRESVIINGHEENCNDNEKYLHIFNNMQSASDVCLPQKTRVIMVIIDALRYDFMLQNKELKKPLAFQNKMPIVSKLMKDHPKSSRLFKFIADPPTTTMQRIKALTTGSLPTFIDAGSNFATNEINEDNIIDQLRSHNGSTVLIGDDTWDGLYPNRFLRKYPYPSFDVWDLDTVDDGVNEHLYPELKNQDWAFLIAHYLGVDHCGHRYGPEHPEMDRKLTEMNTVIENIVETMDENTMLVVLGDHGMTETGDHGGDSDDEVTAGLFIYSKRTLSDLGPSLDTIRQINIVPTLAAVLGVSIPFSNLGTTILNTLPFFNNTYIEEWQFSLFHIWSNMEQVMTYIDYYYEENPGSFDEHVMTAWKQKYSIFKSKIYSVNNEINFETFAHDCTEFLKQIRETCEQVWIQFDSYSMTRGLLFLFLSMSFVYMIADGIPKERLPELFMSSFLSVSYAVVFLSAAVAYILHYFQYVTNLTSTIFFLTGMTSQFMLVMLVIQNWELITLNWYDRSHRERIPNLICRLVLIFHLCGLLSNSFVVEEASVFLFLLSTVILIGSLSVTQNETKKRDYKSKLKLLSIAIGILLFVRITAYFWRCRDRLEQPWCYENNQSFIRKFEGTKMQWVITVVCLALFVTTTKVWLRNCGNLNGYSVTVTFLKYLPTVLVVCMSGYWVLNRLPLDTKTRSVRSWQTNILAWLVYGFSGVGIVVTVFKPLSIYILPGTENELCVESQENVIPQLFQHVKKIISEPVKQQVPVVCGLGTVYSAVYVAIGVYLTLLFALLHGDAFGASTVIMFITAAFVLIIISIISLEKATRTEQLFEIPNMAILVWTILAQYFFYGTGHQPSFPNIIWDAAFVGTSGVSQSNFIAATFVVMNTFCSQILMGFLVPLLIIMPFTISLLMPSVIKRNITLRENLRGEILLFENDTTMITVVFTTMCKYIMCHGIRVFTTMLAATIHCRHMMIWKIFAPKLIFESIGLFITIAVGNVSFLLLLRINYKVERLITSLNKKFS